MKEKRKYSVSVGVNRLLFPVQGSNIPSGGRKFIYHVVDMLNEAGLDALVVHPAKGDHLTWFENQTRVGYMLDLFPNQKDRRKENRLKYWWKNFKKRRGQIKSNPRSQQLNLRKTDVIVLPETRLPLLHRMPSQCRKIIFNQNPYFTFSLNFPPGHLPAPRYFGSDILGMLVVSNLNMKMQKFVFPKLNIVQGQLFVEEDFRYQAAKKRQIAYMPRRGADESLAIFNMLWFRGLSDEEAIVPIDEMSQAEVADALSESLIFLSFTHREGFGLPAAEAMASGCIVIGYSGNGGDEFFNPEFCYPIQQGDFVTFVDTIDNVLDMSLNQPEKLDQMRDQASKFIRQHYSREASQQSIVAAFQKLLKDSDC